jgi:opacity protein-like surface antigen
MTKSYAFVLLGTLLLTGQVSAADSGLFVGIDAGQSRAELGKPNPSGPQPAIGFPLDQVTQDASDAALGFHVGYAFSKHFSLELAYLDAGESSRTMEMTPAVVTFPADIALDPNGGAIFANPSFSSPVPINATFDAGVAGSAILPFATKREAIFKSSALTLTAKGRYEFAHQLGIYGGIGFVSQSVTARTKAWIGTEQVFDDHSHRYPTSADAVVGADWKFHPHWDWRIQYERYIGGTVNVEDIAKRKDMQIVTSGLSYRF